MRGQDRAWPESAITEVLLKPQGSANDLWPAAQERLGAGSARMYPCGSGKEVLRVCQIIYVWSIGLPRVFDGARGLVSV